MIREPDHEKPYKLFPATGHEIAGWDEALLYDCEANGLLDRPDYKLHCAWFYDMRDRHYYGFRPDELHLMKPYLKGRLVVAHNALGYDAEATAMGLGDCEVAGWIDTLVLCRMLWAADQLADPDARLYKKGKLPGNKIKSQGIEAWGYRLGVMKGDYSEECKKKGIDPWEHFNEDMFAYNKQDVVVMKALYLMILRKLGWYQGPDYDGYCWPAAPVELEHYMQDLCLHQERRGFGFNMEKAIDLSATLAEQRAALEAKVSSAFKPWWQPKGDTKVGTKAERTIRRRMMDLPKVWQRRFSDKTGKELKPVFDHPWCTLEAGSYYVPIKYTEFSLSNRHHLANRLQAVFGWKPRAFGGARGTDPVIDEATLKAIDDSVLPPDMKQAILDYYVIDKTYRTLTLGKNAWMRLYDEQSGTIHGRCNPLGTVTHRAAHDKPNLGNIPSVELDEEKDKSGKVISKSIVTGVEGGFGAECRELFEPGNPFDTQTGTDVYALELFTLAHYLFPFDGGLLIEKLSDPDYDIHTDNSTLLGIPRKDCKTTTYKTLYGSGALDIGRDVWKPEDSVAEWSKAAGVKAWIRFKQELLGDAFKMPSRKEQAFYGKGRLYQRMLLDAIPGLADLRKGVTEAGKKGTIRLIDGRRVFVRKDFASLNTLLQGSGAVICKAWLKHTHDALAELGLRQSVLDPRGQIVEAHDYNQVAWVHDEDQVEHFKRHTEAIHEGHRIGIERACKALNLRTMLRVESKTGGNWKSCH